jgi:hypothetical protein
MFCRDVYFERIDTPRRERTKKPQSGVPDWGFLVHELDLIYQVV